MPPENPENSRPEPAWSAEDRLRIKHMLRCARDAQQIVGGSTAEEIEQDMVRSRALVNCFTEIGEAAARLSSSVRISVPGVPWRDVVGMRNIIVHRYWGIDLRELVTTVRKDLPELIQSLDRACKHLDESPS